MDTNVQPTGSHSVKNRLPKTFEEALKAYKDEVKKNEALRLENLIQKQLLNELQPNESYYDWILANKDFTPTNQIAKDYGMTVQVLNDKLNELGVLDEYYKLGYVTNEGFTQKGRLSLYELLKDNGILPTIEQE